MVGDTPEGYEEVLSICDYLARSLYIGKAQEYEGEDACSLVYSSGPRSCHIAASSEYLQSYLKYEDAHRVYGTMEGKVAFLLTSI